MSDGMYNRLIAGFLGLMAILGLGTGGYFILGGGRWSVADCLYMTVITLTTVGYGEVLDDFSKVEHVRPFTVALIVLGMGVFVYFASTLTAFIIEGDLRRALRSNRMRNRIMKMRGHIIVCGVGATGRHVVEELLVTGTPTVAIDLQRERLEQMQQGFPRARYGYIVGDATDDQILEQARLNTARGLVAALPTDKDNMYVVVSARQASSNLRIVARGIERTVVGKLKKAGADRVVSPNYIGGLRMVSEMVRPAAVEFLDEMLRNTKAAVRIEEVVVAEESELTGCSVRDAAIRQRSRVLVLAIRQPGSGSYVYNPTPELVIESAMTLVVLGASKDVENLRQLARGSVPAVIKGGAG